MDEAAELAQDVEAVELEEAPPAAEAPVAEQEPEPVLDLEPSKPGRDCFIGPQIYPLGSIVIALLC